MNDKKLVIAHRGASFYEKGNSLDSFRKAIELGADFIEFDARKTKDNKIIVFHDKKINKEKIKELSFEEINKKIGHRVLTLEETLQYLRGKIKIDVHLKEKGFEKEAVELILKYFEEKDFFVSSLYYSSLKIIKDNFKNVKTGLLINFGFKSTLGLPFGFYPYKKMALSHILN